MCVVPHQDRSTRSQRDRTRTYVSAVPPRAAPGSSPATCLQSRSPRQLSDCPRQCTGREACARPRLRAGRAEDRPTRPARWLSFDSRNPRRPRARTLREGKPTPVPPSPGAGAWCVSLLYSQWLTAGIDDIWLECLTCALGVEGAAWRLCLWV